MALTLSQKETIEDSIWVVNTALKRQGLENDKDLKQSAILYMCKCLLRFDPSKNVRWTTFAYQNVYLYIKRTHRKETVKNSYIVNENIDKYEEIIPDSEQAHNEHHFVAKLLERCNEEEKKIIKYKMQGYTNTQISKMANISITHINTCYKRIKNKAKGLTQ